MAINPKDLPDYEYQCSGGHDLASPKPITKCPAYIRGAPCKGTLSRFGKGSRSS